MRGHVKKVRGNWYAVLELDPVDGVREQKWLSPRKELGLNRRATKKEAEALLIKKLNAVHAGTYYEPSDDTLGQYLNRWLKNYPEPNLQQKTIDFYEYLIRVHIKPEIGNIPLTKLRPAHIQELLTKKSKSGRADGKPGGLSRRTVQGIHQVLKLALKHAVEWEIAVQNVATRAKTKAPGRKKPNAWDRDQAALFLGYLRNRPDRLYPLYLLALTTGMRRGEIIGLRWSDVSLTRHTVTIKQAIVNTSKGNITTSTKTEESERTIDTSPLLSAALKEHKLAQQKEFVALGVRPKHNLVFTSQAGTPLDPGNLYRHFASTINRINKGGQVLPRITFHGMRDTHATLLLEAGIHVKAVAQRLGQTNEVTLLSRYAHALPAVLKDAASKVDYLFDEE